MTSVDARRRTPGRPRVDTDRRSTRADEAGPARRPDARGTRAGHGDGGGDGRRPPAAGVGAGGGRGRQPRHGPLRARRDPPVVRPAELRGGAAGHRRDGRGGRGAARPARRQRADAGRRARPAAARVRPARTTGRTGLGRVRRTADDGTTGFASHVPLRPGTTRTCTVAPTSIVRLPSAIAVQWKKCSSPVSSSRTVP